MWLDGGFASIGQRWLVGIKFGMQNPLPIPELLADLAQFATAVSQLSLSNKSELSKRPSPQIWSLTEIMCHLRDVEIEVHQQRLKVVLDKEDAFISGASPDDWADERHYQSQDGLEAWQSFLNARQQTIQLLPYANSPLWQRAANHAFFGRTTLHELLNLIVQHDAAHWQQIKELLE